MTRLKNKVSRHFILVFGKFLVVGFSSMLLNLSVLLILNTLGVAQLFASILATELSIIYNFVLHEHWTFKKSSNNYNGTIVARFLQFQLLAWSTSCLTVGLFFVFTHMFNVYYLLAQASAIAIVTLVNFGVNSYFTWNLFGRSKSALNELPSLGDLAEVKLQLLEANSYQETSKYN